MTMKVYGKLTALGMAGVFAMISSAVVAAEACCMKENAENASGCGAVCTMEKQGAGTACVMTSLKKGSVTTLGLAALIKAKAPSAILDARSGQYDDGKRIPGATQLSPKAEESDIAKLLPDKKAMIVTYCAGVKCPASKMLADKLKTLGYSNVIEYPEGIAGWIAAGNAIEQKGK
jgi:rhodanese-related sulfurtransferase